jgi:two-component system, OmpR family, sensor histidine kinase KdpD
VSARRRALVWIAWSVTTLAVTLVLVALRGQVEQAHVTLIYLLLVLLGSATGGRRLGFVLALTGFLLIDYLFQTPYGTLSVDKGVDWIVLLAFLVTAVVATHLLARAAAAAAAAGERADEIDRLSSLGAETLSVGRAEDALTAIAKVIRETIGVADCEIQIRDPDAVRAEPVVPAAALVERAPAVRAARTLLVPLEAHGRTVGELRLADPEGLDLDPAKVRLLNFFAYYAALAVDRVRLVAAAEHAEALREADRLKDAVLASVSHDLRTPLTTIKALAHDIAEAGEERAAVIEQQADRLNRTVADLLDLSCLDAGGVRVRIEVNTAEDLVGAALQEVSGMLRGREVITDTVRDNPVEAGRFDFVHSLRVLTNLLENAIKYSPACTPIEISVSREDGVLVFAVADRGVGVPASERERIFAPFYRPASAPPDTGGAGLGLAIARRLAIVQGGSLAYRPRPGGGSIFELRLPAAAPEDAPPSL